MFVKEGKVMSSTMSHVSLDEILIFENILNKIGSEIEPRGFSYLMKAHGL